VENEKEKIPTEKKPPSSEKKVPLTPMLRGRFYPDGFLTYRCFFSEGFFSLSMFIPRRGVMVLRVADESHAMLSIRQHEGAAQALAKH